MTDASKKVDLVVLIDTSASMKDEAEALNKGMVTAIEDAKKACPSDLRVQFLGIEGTFASTEFTKTARQYLTGIGVDAGTLTARAHGGAKDSSAQEQIAQTVVDLSRHFDWRAGAERALFVLGDESLDGGGLTIGAKAVKANDRAIEAALAGKVKVHAYQTTLPSQPTPEQETALTEEYKRLALRTGGEYYIHTQGLADFRKVLQDAICASRVPVDDSIKDKEKEADAIEGEAGGGDKPAGRPVPWSGKVDATSEQGTATGITVSAGELITVLAKGWANYGMNNGPFSPQGNPNHSETGCLKMRIGADHIEYIQNGVFRWPAPVSGDVAFIYHDAPGEYYNNTGHFDVTFYRENA
ncbi:MAG TPA: LecA/PA-IL family lectin [Inquilinus sp.]|nr:LecA/PA-IL family lectin [Inquilinus sp.]